MTPIRLKISAPKPDGIPEPNIGIGGMFQRFTWLNGASNYAFVYILRAGDTNSYKVGFARDVEQRILTLQTGSADKLVVVKDYWLPDVGLAIRAEKAAHRRFEPWRLHGEWFRLTNDIAIIGVSLEIRETIKQPAIDGAAWREYSNEVHRQVRELNEPLDHRKMQMASGWI